MPQSHLGGKKNSHRMGEGREGPGWERGQRGEERHMIRYWEREKTEALRVSRKKGEKATSGFRR